MITGSGEGSVLRAVRQDRGAHQFGRPGKRLSKVTNGEKNPSTCRPAEVLEPELAKAKEEIKGALAADIDDLKFSMPFTR